MVGYILSHISTILMLFFFYFAAYIDHGIFTILGLIDACIYCLIVELYFYIAYLYAWAMFVEQIFLEIEVILISHTDL